jgi:uncharacterized protein (TIGR04255 family)
MTDDAIVTYRQPPLVEVVVSVTFRRLMDAALPAMWSFYSQGLKPTFPTVAEQPPYEPTIERLDQTPGGVTFNFQLGAPPSPRLTFLDAEGAEMVQLQKDWFACNWRKVRPDAEYSRWPSRRDAFSRYWGAFQEHLKQQGLEQPEVLGCEVTYLNQVNLPPQQALKQLAGLGDLDGLTLERTSFQQSFLVQGEEGPIGRLHISGSPVTAIDGSSAFLLELTARGKPLTEADGGVIGFLNRGRAAIVNAFSSIITESADQAWERQL